MNTAPRPDLSQQSRPRLVTSPQRESDTATDDRTIGELIGKAKNLSDAQLESIAAHQRTHGLRFGEAAVALGLASQTDVIYALSQQFQYPYSREGSSNPDLTAAAHPFSWQAEAFRNIRSQLLASAFSPEQPRRAITVISINRGDGRTYFTANLGVVFAQLGGRTLLIDGDMRNPSLARYFGISAKAGLSGILSGRQEDEVIYQAPDLPGLFVMPVGITPPNPLELLERPAFKLLLGELVRKFDHVFVDTPSLDGASDGFVAAVKSGCSLVLARQNITKHADLTRVAHALTSSKVSVAGTVLNEY